MFSTAWQCLVSFLNAALACFGMLTFVALLVLLIMEPKIRPRLLNAVGSGVLGGIPVAVVFYTFPDPSRLTFAATLGFFVGFAVGVLGWCLRGGLRPAHEQGSSNNRWRGP
jgi:hypothetical protein